MKRNEEYLELMKELEGNTPDLRASIQKARSRRNKAVLIYRPLSGLVACFALFVLLVNFSTLVAQACAKVPVLRQLAEAVTFSKSLSNAVENDYVQHINLTQKDGGVTAKVEYVIVDQKQVNIFYRLESEEYRNMYASPKVLNKDGTGEEPCVWTTPINDVPNEELRLIILDYLEEEVPNNLQLVIYAYVDNQVVAGDDNLPIAEFTFSLEFDAKKIAEAKMYPVHQTLDLDGQSITVTEIQVYPTHLRLNVVDKEGNTCWLNNLDFYIETEKGRLEPSAGGVTAAGTTDGKGMTSFRADSLYFYEAEQMKLVITGARWLRKDMEKIRIDLETGATNALPNGVTWVQADDENAMSPAMFHVRWDWDERQPIMLSGVYYDAAGTRCNAPWAVKSCNEHEGNCWYEWLSLKDYHYDHIWICPTYTHGWEATEPIIITLQD